MEYLKEELFLDGELYNSSHPIFCSVKVLTLFVLLDVNIGSKPLKKFLLVLLFCFGFFCISSRELWLCASVWESVCILQNLRECPQLWKKWSVGSQFPCATELIFSLMKQESPLLHFSLWINSFSHCHI